MDQVNFTYQPLAPCETSFLMRPRMNQMHSNGSNPVHVRSCSRSRLGHHFSLLYKFF